MGHFDSLALLIGVGLDYYLIKSGSKNPIIIFWDGDGEKEPNDTWVNLGGRAPLVAKRHWCNMGLIIYSINNC